MAERLSRAQALTICVLWLGGMVVLAVAGWYLYRPVLAARYVAKAEAALVALRQEPADEALAQAAKLGADVAVLQTYRTTDPRAFQTLIAQKGTPQLQQKLAEALREGEPGELVSRARALANEGYPALAQYPLQQALAKDPELPQVHHALFELYQTLGLPEQASVARAARDRLTKRYLWEEQGLLNPDGTLR